MLLSLHSEEKTEETIVEILHNGGQTGPTLLESVQKKDKKISKETFYRVIRRLLKEEVLNKNKSIYQLNRYWLQRIYQFGKKHIKEEVVTDNDHILSFKDGDKIRYKFKNPNTMGIYWTHIYDMVYENHDPKIPILVFHPHEWLIYTRVKSELFFLSKFKDEKKLALFSVGGNTPLDKKFKNDWNDEYIQISTGTSHGFKKTEYINILGDFIFKITVSKKWSDDIEKFFSTHTDMDSKSQAELVKLCNRNDEVRMLFTRSKKEADKWRAKYKKHFYIPKGYVK